MAAKKRRTKLKAEPETIDGGEGRGVPLGGHDDRPPTGYASSLDVEEVDHLWDDEASPERRRDPLRTR